MPKHEEGQTGFSGLPALGTKPTMRFRWLLGLVEKASGDTEVGTEVLVGLDR
jgi:hypothetical protein